MSYTAWKTHIIYKQNIFILLETNLLSSLTNGKIIYIYIHTHIHERIVLKWIYDLLLNFYLYIYFYKSIYSGLSGRILPNMCEMFGSSSSTTCRITTHVLRHTTHTNIQTYMLILTQHNTTHAYTHMHTNAYNHL